MGTSPRRVFRQSRARMNIIAAGSVVLTMYLAPTPSCSHRRMEGRRYEHWHEPPNELPVERLLAVLVYEYDSGIWLELPLPSRRDDNFHSARPPVRRREHHASGKLSNLLPRARDSAVRSALIWQCSGVRHRGP